MEISELKSDMSDMCDMCETMISFLIDFYKAVTYDQRPRCWSEK